MSELHRIYFVPGLFGFGRLAGYDYFNHLRAGLEMRFSRAGIKVAFADVPTPPTSSLRYRAGVLARTIHDSSGSNGGPIHIVGHSTGGLDARLVLSPTANLHVDPELLDWIPRARSAISMNTPHYGTPLASYFASVSGTRMLYALSLLTIVSLSLGEPSLAVFSKLLAGIGGIDSLFGSDLRVFSRLTDGVLRFVDRDGRTEILTFLEKIRTDQGAIVQTMPEAMDLFNAVAKDTGNIRFGSVASAAPAPGAMRFARRVRSPYAALTAALYTTLYKVASQNNERYPYARPSAAQAEQLARSIGLPLDDTTNDGIVPTLSMTWGELVWAGEGDHLDVLGHFQDEARPAVHVDWVTSGAHFTRQRFDELLDAMAKFQLRT
jgi:hypothetical protein